MFFSPTDGCRAHPVETAAYSGSAGTAPHQEFMRRQKRNYQGCLRPCHAPPVSASPLYHRHQFTTTTSLSLQFPPSLSLIGETMERVMSQLHYSPAALAGILPKRVQQLLIQGGFLDDPSGNYAFPRSIPTRNFTACRVQTSSESAPLLASSNSSRQLHTTAAWQLWLFQFTHLQFLFPPASFVLQCLRKLSGEWNKKTNGAEECA